MVDAAVEFFALEKDAKERVVAQCAQKRGRGRLPGFRMSDARRVKIKK